MVTSRNQMILDLISPIPENYVYKNTSQREAWGTIELFDNSTSRYSREFLEIMFPKRKNETDTKRDIPDRESLH